MTMKLNKLAAIPAIALAAGISLAACGSSGTPAAAPTVTVPPTTSSSAPSGQAAACADWQQTKAAATTADGNADIQAAMNAAGANSTLYHDLEMVYLSVNEAGNTHSPGGIQVYGAAVNKICGTSAATQSNGLPSSGVWYPGSKWPNVACGPPTSQTAGLNTSYVDQNNNGVFTIDMDDPQYSPCNS
jgi:hypothetical protein